MNMIERFGGVYPALLTPFTKTGINEKVLRELVEYNIKKGVNAPNEVLTPF